VGTAPGSHVILAGRMHAHRLCPVVFCRPSTVPITRKKRRARPAHRCCSPFLVALVSHRPGEGGERRRGNKKGTNPGPPDRTGRTRRTAIVLRTPPRVLSSTATNCGPPFGTKRPQVQILSPRPVPQVADLRECRALRATSHLPASRQRPQRNKKEHEGTPGNAGPPSTGRRTPLLPARRSRPRGTAGSFRAL
jgi:hypothetical protein